MFTERNLSEVDYVYLWEFLPQHRHHQQQVLQIITAAEARGQTRMVEMIRHVADNLAKIITTLENGEANTSRETSADAS